MLSKGARADLCIHDASNVKEGAPTLEDMAFCFPRSASKSAHLARELFIECAESAGRAAPLTTRKQKEEYQAGFFMHDVLLLCMVFLHTGHSESFGRGQRRCASDAILATASKRLRRKSAEM